MAQRAYDSFDSYNGVGANAGLQSMWPATSTSGLSLIAGQFAGQAVRWTTQTASQGFESILRNFKGGATATFANGWWMRTSDIANTEGSFFNVWWCFTSGGAPQWGLRVGALGQLIACRPATLYQQGVADIQRSAVGAIRVNTWHFIEVENTAISATVGAATVYIDGVAAITMVNVNNKVQGAATVDGFCSVRARTQGVLAIDMDDYYENDNATKTGMGTITTLVPSSDSAVTFTPNAGANNWSRVSEAQVDSDTTYNQGTTVGNADQFGIGALPSTPATVYGAQLVCFPRKTDATARTLYLELTSGATVDDGTAVVLNSSYNRFERMLAVDPNTAAAWAYANINAAKIGYKIAS